MGESTPKFFSREEQCQSWLIGCLLSQLEAILLNE